jgi:hypothetical protein
MTGVCRRLAQLFGWRNRNDLYCDGSCKGSALLPTLSLVSYTDKKKRKFSSYIRQFRMEQLQSHIPMRKGFLICEEMRKYLTVYEEAVSHIWLCNCSILNFFIFEENLIFFLISVPNFVARGNGWFILWWKLQKECRTACPVTCQLHW